MKRKGIGKLYLLFPSDGEPFSLALDMAIPVESLACDLISLRAMEKSTVSHSLTVDSTSRPKEICTRSLLTGSPVVTFRMW